MKTFLTLALCLSGGLYAGAAITVDRQDLQHSLIYAGLAEIDLNCDGHLDLIYSGEVREATSGRIVEDAEGNEVQINFNTFTMIWNPATGSYDFAEFPYYFGNKPYFAVYDWNGDGKTDFFCAGEASMGQSEARFGFFLNDGHGNFTRQEITVVDEDGEVIDPFDPKCADLGDFNSDGLMDLVVSGWKNDAFGERHNYNMVLLNQGDYKFLATNRELLIYGDNTYEFGLNLLTAADLNNDGYADFLVQGNIDNADEGDKPVKNGKVMGRTFVAALNLGAEADGETILYDLNLAESPAHHYGHGGMLVADYNNDGVPDIFVGGESPDDASNGWAYNWQLLQGKITSDGVTYTDVTSAQAFAGKDIRPLNDNNPVRAIDYNGDGLYDLFVPGWCETMLDGTGNTQAGWFFPNVGGQFPNYERIPGSSECAVFFTEDGVTGARNYGFLGQSWDGNYFVDDTDVVTGRMLLFTKNPYEKAARPDAPTNLKAEVNNYDVTLSWDAAPSSKANVTYEYYIRRVANGKYYHGVPAFVGGDKDGIRTTLAQGRAFMARKLDLVGLPDGVYEWGVQTVNAGLEGSVFAKGGNFTIGEGDTAVEMISGAADVIETRYYDLAGRRINGMPEKGVVIEKQILSNGTAKVQKRIL